jgi:diketogulonate reductase-like aldo/keto reductase
MYGSQEKGIAIMIGIDSFVLPNGLPVPAIGYGTYKLETAESVKTALQLGLRHIDTASIYRNEESVGQAIKESGIKRENLFLTGKLWNPDQGYETTLRAFEKTIENLQTDYLDLYLIHWPVPMYHENEYQELNRQTWRAFEKLYADKKVRAIGVSNFLQRHLLNIMNSANVKPMVNQLEIHPLYQQNDLVNFCNEQGIFVEAWSPFKVGEVFAVGTLVEIAGEYRKDVAQLCLRWLLQKGILPIFKSDAKHRIASNVNVWDFVISDEHMERISELDDINGHTINRDYERQQNY